ncbi:hypothetical protein Nepgr_013937 [Nepenthes gracilis]|uniref:Protein kinase domain-containing protein n=1 Tax=Nepenthes gracilis TaxID=150966 RepID=A0AAD3SK22_NEPGR|nr:hypothetical protein Nepgr_013937 [Nepenthes gracilis]
MGCVCAKPSAVGDVGKSPRETTANKQLSDCGVHQAALKRGDSQVTDRSESVRSSLIDKQANGSVRAHDDHSQKIRVNSEVLSVDYPGSGVVPKAKEGEHVAAGWPCWLAEAAGEAISGWVPRCVDTFKKLDKVGQGTYSSVYKARDLTNDKTVALKRVRFDNLDPESIQFMAREILILRRLDHPNIIKLEGLMVSATTGSLYLIFEYMEHDLMGLVSLPGLKFTESQVKCYMQQLLRGLDHCHSHGVLHRDIKGSNLLIDNGGILKIADFGLATFYEPSQPLTSRVVTLWYRPPELLLGATDYGPAVDLWSTGCILGEMYAGKPILPGRTEVEQLHKIFKLCGSPSEDFWIKSKLPHSTTFRPQQPYRRRVAERFSDIPATAVGLIETLLSIDPSSRGTADSALKSEFFTMEPLACNPSSLPKYPPSKEIDARMREQQNKRHEAMVRRGKMVDLRRQGLQAPPAALSLRPGAELVSSMQMQRRKLFSDSISRGETPNSRREDSPSCHPPGPPRNSEAANGVGKEIFDYLYKSGTRSGPLTIGAGWPNPGRKPISRPVVPSGSKSLILSSEDRHENPRPSPNTYAASRAGRFPRLFHELENSRNQDWFYYMQDKMCSQKLEQKASFRTTAMFQHGSRPDNDRIHLSGPLLVPSNDADRMLRQHDLRIQEAARRARLEKSWRSTVQAYVGTTSTPHSLTSIYGPS